jgi:hypothetical protein
MSQANVDDLDVFRAAKAAVVRFQQAADAALINADSQMRRVLSWLENEQITYWQGQIRKRTDAVTRAKEAVRQKKLFKDAVGRTPYAVQEEKILRAALGALEEAERRLDATRKSIPKLHKEIEAYRGGVQGLGSALAVEVPKAIALLQQAAINLEDYVNLASSSTGGDLPPAPAPSDQANMDRGGESAEAAQPASVRPAPPQQEDGDVNR